MRSEIKVAIIRHEFYREPIVKTPKHRRFPTRYNSPMKLALAIFALIGASLSAQNTATVPVTLDHNRVIIDVRFRMPDGSTTRVRAWVNNGTQEMTITDHLAKKLRLSTTDGTTPPPSEIRIGTLAIHPTQIKQTRVVIAGSVAPGLSPEITLPAPLLRDYDLLVDYPNRELTIAAPGSMHFKGTAVKSLSEGESLQLPSEFAGKKQTLTLDLGSSITSIPAAIASKLEKNHPHMTGAVAIANQWGSADETRSIVLRLPLLRVGGVSEKDVVVSSSTTDTAILGANVLQAYRVGIDYQHATVYFDRTAATRLGEMDVVGLTLRPEVNEKYTVVSVADLGGKPAVSDVKPGDVLVKIDGIDADGGTMGQVWSLLTGSPGDIRELTLEREGKQLTVKATVRGFLKTQHTTRSKTKPSK